MNYVDHGFSGSLSRYVCRSHYFINYSSFNFGLDRIIWFFSSPLFNFYDCEIKLPKHWKLNLRMRWFLASSSLNGGQLAVVLFFLSFASNSYMHRRAMAVHCGWSIIWFKVFEFFKITYLFREPSKMSFRKSQKTLLIQIFGLYRLL